MSAITPNSDFHSEPSENRVLPTEFEPAIQKRGKSAKKPTKEPVKKAVVDLFADTQQDIAKLPIKAKLKVEKAVVLKMETPKVSAVSKLPETPTVELIKSDNDEFAHYKSLTNYHKKCLVATNYWRVMNGLEVIPVPQEYTYYHKRFDARCYELYAEKTARKS
jgi:hypothetical protein